MCACECPRHCWARFCDSPGAPRTLVPSLFDRWVLSCNLFRCLVAHVSPQTKTKRYPGQLSYFKECINGKKHFEDPFTSFGPLWSCDCIDVTKNCKTNPPGLKSSSYATVAQMLRPSASYTSWTWLAACPNEKSHREYYWTKVLCFAQAAACSNTSI